MFHDRNFLGGTALATAALLAAPSIVRRARTRDGMMTYDQATIDSAGAFLVGELERLDPTLNEPLVAYTWSRDIDLREDVSIADEVASFTNSTFAAVGGIQPNGKAWAGKDANAIASLALDIGKTPQPLNLWAMELSWTIPELESAIRLGRPIDSQKLEGLNLKLQMDTDEQVYIGDALLGIPGLVNSSLITATNVVNGASSSPLWAQKTPAEILKDVNTLLNAAWAASGWKVAPTELRLPPVQFGYIVSQTVSSAGNISILEFLRQNSLSNSINGRPLNIQPLKWLVGRGASNTDRMVAYTKDRKYVQFPMVPLQRTPLEYRSLYQLTTYFGRLGQIEFRYPETLGYADGI
ncbi:DUF2184 domain-containing protein [Labrys neptuniae]